LPITWLAVEKHVLVHTHEQDRLFYSRLDEWQGLTK
jgi:DNA-binding LytR/AlgR family response regulator